MKLKAIVLILLMTSSAILWASAKASPPWLMSESLLKATIGAGECVDVNLEESDDGYIIKIKACREEVARALSFLINFDEIYGIKKFIFIGPDNSAVEELIVDENDINPEFISKQFSNALNKNPYVHKIENMENGFSHVYVICKPEVIQVWTDNLSDLYGNSNYVASKLFGKLLKKEFAGKYRISFTTMQK